ncbi:PREDICTED: serine/threonine-protein kinase DDB_G0283821-like [Drosophila arizonae]|uniref:Serine/threonine-protein kinase DDB_G0283821-like n=1 Tax=Drosophila arizonae TaxID=7263 RepID=A0ABM1PTF5_DROAR|nr:PREDICTED: serine/threonine-protein kinase DDB_G0283821-like [Drosophila arizonae]
MLPTTTSTTIPTRAQLACGSWPYLQHVALHKSGPFTRQTTSDINKTNNKIINNNNITSNNCNSDINKTNININPNANTINLITIRNMSIYDYLRQHFNAAGKRNRRYSTDSDEDVPPPSPKVRKHNHYNHNHHNNNNNNYNNNQQKSESHQGRREQHGKQSPNSNMHNYDIRFFFYINSLILFTMSCRQVEGEDLKHFIVKHIREFDRLRRKARKRRKRKTKPTTSLPL